MTKRESKRPQNSKSEVFESDLCDALPDVFYAIDSDFRLQKWNDRLPKRTGYTDDELAEMSPRALVPEDERPILEKATRAVLERGETQTVESHLLTEDGQRIPHEFNGSPITDESGTVVGLAGTARNIAERKRRENERKQYETLFETINDGVFVLDADLRYTAVNDAFAAMAGYERDQLLDLHASVLSTEEDFERGEQLALEIANGERDVAALESELVRKDGTLLPVETRFTFLQADDAETVVGVVRDVSKRKRRERTLRKHRDELETLNHINVVIRELVWALVSAATREEVERTVCDYLADSDLYRFAWIGERDRDTGGVTVRTEAGIDDGARELFETVDTKNDWERPASEVLHSGELTVINDIESDERFPASIRQNITDSAVRSGIALPFSHGQTVYGVLVVYATRTNAFSEREAKGFEALGELVGFVIDAVESKRLLFADRVVELEFRVTDDTSFFVGVSKDEATITLEEVIPGKNGALLEYVRIDGIPAEDVLKRATESDAIRRIRQVDGTLFELVITEASPVLTLAERGASVSEAIAENGTARIVTELPADADVRSVVETLETAFPATELVGKHERKQPARAVHDFREELEDDLTERQLAILRAAYTAGYFDWPRASTAEDVAEALGISAPTLHQHLRKAEAKVFSSFLAE
ncbi:PAS domain S-box-containing protein [Haladaptatus litoreus]|uniref:PAS domain S-box-containing protein n=1 Tax=Haladaptatus litoreus TaxID=553468 RepID=A0A1N6UXS4_9EURY|nr:PAS domain S-box protein [Haladaptatus litoreus]SIQ70420.1 PAS domain S-box-containing protein [Haladaptatus litoreus]